MSLVSLGLAVSALTMIALSMHRHARQIDVSPRLAGAAWPRRLGWTLLALSFAVAVTRPGWRIAIVEWIGLAGAAAAIVAMLLTYRPRALPLVSLLLLAGSAIAVAAS